MTRFIILISSQLLWVSFAKSFIYHGETSLATYKVSSTLSKHYVSKYMFDSSSSTFWHSWDKNAGVTVEFLTPKTISKVVIKRRSNCCTHRYGPNVCFSLLDSSDSELAKKCTTDKYGKPFLVGSSLIVSFSSVSNVKHVKLSGWAIKGNKHAQ